MTITSVLTSAIRFIITTSRHFTIRPAGQVWWPSRHTFQVLFLKKYLKIFSFQYHLKCLFFFFFFFLLDIKNSEPRWETGRCDAIVVAGRGRPSRWLTSQMFPSQVEDSRTASGNDDDDDSTATNHQDKMVSLRWITGRSTRSITPLSHPQHHPQRFINRSISSSLSTGIWISRVNNFYNSNSNSNLILEWEIHRKSTRNDEQSAGRASSLSITHFHQRNWVSSSLAIWRWKCFSGSTRSTMGHLLFFFIFFLIGYNRGQIGRSCPQIEGPLSSPWRGRRTDRAAPIQRSWWGRYRRPTPAHRFLSVRSTLNYTTQTQNSNIYKMEEFSHFMIYDTFWRREAIGWTRGDYYAASGRRIALVRSMMADWKRLKDMRTSQGFACTSCQLSVVDQGKNRKKKNKKMTSAAAAQDQHEQQQPPPPLDWDEEIERQMDESRRLFKEHVRSDSDRYNREKAQWKLKKRTTTRSKKQRKVHHITQKKGGIL